MASIELKKIEDILGQSFFIPDYQRGYRWGEEQVKDLLNDLNEFSLNQKDNNEIYCLQPLVVQKKENGVFDVIDGQQRLTTIYIILSCLGEETLYSIEYETREKSKEFLAQLGKQNNYKDNPDFYFMHHTYDTVQEWINEKKVNKSVFNGLIKNHVNFIWYEIDSNEDPIKVFTRLNIGKISLTESELIKALFLNRNNFGTTIEEKNKLITLIEIANEWDKIEYRLQDDRFWLFFHDPEYHSPTRIDFIMDVVRMMDKNKTFEDRVYPSFTYYYEEIKNAGDKQKQQIVSDLWMKIYSVFSVLEEWYNDERIFHYIGYLTSLKTNLSTEKIVIDYIEKYKKSNGKENFVLQLKNDIRKRIKDCSDLDFIYESNNTNNKIRSKTETRPILLLHNVQTVINQNDSYKNEKKYSISDFIRFPFHLFKKENWDVEHIRPNNLQDFQGERKEGAIKKFLLVLQQSNDPQISNIVKDYDESNGEDRFEKLWEAINKGTNELDDNQKNKIWNYVLLDSSTNREYGNSCFSIKRDYVLKKDRGIKPIVRINGDKAILEYVKKAAFVPICTRKVFSKEYTQYPDNLSHWTVKDAAFYRMDIEETLWEYLSDDKGMNYDVFKQEFKDYREKVVSGEDYEKTFANYCKEKKGNKN